MTYEFADPGVIVHEDISFGLNISDGSTVVGHSFIRRVSIRSTAKTLNDFPHVWIIGIGHCVLEKIFPTFCLGLVDSLGSFIDKCKSTHGDFDGSFNGGNFECGFRLAHESHPRFRFLAGF